MDEVIVKLVQDLVKIDTTQGKSVLAARVLANFLEENGLSPKINEYKPGEANVLTEIGPNTEKIVMSGHLDVVPPGNLSLWEHDPYSGKIIDNELWGRGSVDMKGGVGELAGVLVELLKYEDDLTHKISFAVTAEEEVGLQGAREYVKQNYMKNASHLIIAEPTGLRPMTAEKGIMWFDINATGKQAHASRPDLGLNAIEALAELIPKLHEVLPKKDNSFVGRTTLNIGTISGGTAANVVPNFATMRCDIRTTPGINNDDVLAEIQQILDKSDEVHFDLKVIESVGAVNSPNDEFPTLFDTYTQKYYGKSFGLSAVHYATDGGIFMDQKSVPFVIYGPGSTTMLHQTNERLDLEQLRIARNVTRDAILHIAVPN